MSACASGLHPDERSTAVARYLGGRERGEVGRPDTAQVPDHPIQQPRELGIRQRRLGRPGYLHEETAPVRRGGERNERIP